MDHVAIDLGGRESQICVRTATGAIVRESRCLTTSLREELTALAPSHIVLETCAEAFSVADWARSAGHEVTVVPATLVRALGVGARGIKTDLRDARNLSEAACRMAQLPRVHIPSKPNRDLKSLCSLREARVGARTKLINSVRGWFRGQCVGRIKAGNADYFTRRVREFWATRPEKKPPSAIERQLLAIDALTEQMLAAETELQEFVAVDATCRRLLTVPGVGPIVATRFFSAIDDVSRFPSAHALQSYLGLTPGENSSSDTKRTTGITKAGAARVRWVLQQAAWTAWRTRPSDPMVVWSLEIARRRGRKIAATALARKLAGIMFASWRDGTVYRAVRASSARVESADAGDRLDTVTAPSPSAP